MITGDNRRTAEAIARQVGIKDVRYEFYRNIRLGSKKLQQAGITVAMVGMDK